MQPKPTKEDLLKAYNKSVPDVIEKNLFVLFCGINPGLYTAAIGHHFGHPGNRFWKTLYSAGFTKTILSPYQEEQLLQDHLGITNVVNRATRTGDEVSKSELVNGAKELKDKVLQFTPHYLAILGIGAYRKGFLKPQATVGLQKEIIGSSYIWVLPNPSGLNVFYKPRDIIALFALLHQVIYK